jgi:hypothetical protein
VVLALWCWLCGVGSVVLALWCWLCGVGSVLGVFMTRPIFLELTFTFSKSSASICAVIAWSRSRDQRKLDCVVVATGLFHKTQQWWHRG